MGVEADNDESRHLQHNEYIRTTLYQISSGLLTTAISPAKVQPRHVPAKVQPRRVNFDIDDAALNDSDHLTHSLYPRF